MDNHIAQTTKEKTIKNNKVWADRVKQAGVR